MVFMYPIAVCIARRVGPAGEVEDQLSGKAGILIGWAIQQMAILPVGDAGRRENQVAAAAECTPVDMAIGYAR